MKLARSQFTVTVRTYHLISLPALPFFQICSGSFKLKFIYFHSLAANLVQPRRAGLVLATAGGAAMLGSRFSLPSVHAHGTPFLLIT